MAAAPTRSTIWPRTRRRPRGSASLRERLPVGPAELFAELAIAELDPEFWQFGMTLFALGAVSPWLSLIDHGKFSRYVDKVQGLDITTIASCHSPGRGARVAARPAMWDGATLFGCS